jgi:hypothetical protein
MLVVRVLGKLVLDEFEGDRIEPVGSENLYQPQTKLLNQDVVLAKLSVRGFTPIHALFTK